MAKFLLKLESGGSLVAFRDLPAPPDYLVECFGSVPALVEAGLADGLEHWRIDVQVASSLAAWAKGPEFDALWDFLGVGLQGYDVRPRGLLSVRGRADPRRVGVAFRYIGDGELKRVRDGLREKIAVGFDPVAKRLKADIELHY